jgi:8-oxo-dGTP pyrophosphatase MutT (NUDIX family)
MSNKKTDYQRTTIVFPYNAHGILLGMKKRGFGEGWWNGFGGKLEAGEEYEDAAKRETMEEVGLQIKNLLHIADLAFYFNDKLGVVSKAYTAEFRGSPIETDEMRPAFFADNELPYKEMWPADKLWIPKALEPTSPLPLGFVVNFEENKSFRSIEQVNVNQLELLF